MRDCLNEILNETCLLSLTQPNQELLQRLPQKSGICDRTLASSLKEMLFRIKLARLVPAERNRLNVIQKRLDYANWFMGHAVVNYNVFLNKGMVVNTIFGLQEVTKEQLRRGKEPTDRFVVSEEEM